MARILLVDDEPSILSVLSALLKAEGYAVVPTQGGQTAQELLSTDSFDLMITDIRMSPVNGMDLLRTARAEHPSLPVIMLTAYGSVETAIEAMKLGAFEYVTKPFKVDELLITVQRALQFSSVLSENADLKAQLDVRYHLGNIVAESASMKNVCEMIKKVAPTETTVMIQGESGTGKELVAKAIHACSLRKEHGFVAVNCAALPEPLLESEMFGHAKGSFTGASSEKVGLFEAASGGTIFLDEVGSIPQSIQGKLLRVLQEREVRRVGSNTNIAVDARVLAATNTPLEELMAKGTFREDLYYRLSVIPLHIAPLRERTEDILPLAYNILKRETGEHQPPLQIAPEVSAILEAYSWPGNVRELENAIKHAITFAKDSRITRDGLPPRITMASGATVPTFIAPGAVAQAASEPSDLSLKAFLRKKEQEYIRQTLESAGGSKEEAARRLKISLATLYRKLPDSE